MLSTPESMLSDLRDWLDEPKAAFWTEERLMGRLNDAQQRIVRDISMEAPDAFVETYDISYVADQATYDLPLNARLGTRWIAVENRQSGEPYFYVLDIALERYLFSENDSWPWTGNGISQISLQGEKVRISPVPNQADSNAIRYMYAPAYGNMIQWPVASTSSTTVTLSTTTANADPDYITKFGKVDNRNDAYNGMQWYIVSGAGAGQYGKISDYVGLTRTFTLESAPSVSLATSSIFAVVSAVPEDFRDVQVLMAAKDGVVKGRTRVAEIDNTLFGQPGRPGKWQEMKAWFADRSFFRQETVETWGV